MTRFRIQEWRALGLGVLAVLAFVFAISLLGAATAALEPRLATVLDRTSRSGLSALGVSWLASYVVLNGSVVAAVALSLFANELVSPSSLYLLVAGSRLGAAGVVVLIGGLDHLHRRQSSLREATGLGVLTFLVSHSVYAPATVLGAAILAVGGGDDPTAVIEAGVRPGWSSGLDSVAAAVTSALGAPAAFGLAVALLLASLRAVDTLLSRVETNRIQEVVSTAVDNRFAGYALGFLVTGVSTSVAFSVGLLVPLYNRGLVDREAMVPYLLGASLGTLGDTLLVAVVIGSPTAITVVGLLAVCLAAPTAAALIAYAAYYDAVTTVHDAIETDRRVFVVFIASLVAVPLALVLIHA